MQTRPSLYTAQQTPSTVSTRRVRSQPPCCWSPRPDGTSKRPVLQEPRAQLFGVPAVISTQLLQRLCGPRSHSSALATCQQVDTSGSSYQTASSPYLCRSPKVGPRWAEMALEVPSRYRHIKKTAVIPHSIAPPILALAGQCRCCERRTEAAATQRNCLSHVLQGQLLQCNCCNVSVQGRRGRHAPLGCHMSDVNLNSGGLLG